MGRKLTNGPITTKLVATFVPATVCPAETVVTVPVSSNVTVCPASAFGEGVHGASGNAEGAGDQAMAPGVSVTVTITTGGGVKGIGVAEGEGEWLAGARTVTVDVMAVGAEVDCVTVTTTTEGAATGEEGATTGGGLSVLAGARTTVVVLANADRA